MPGCLIPFLHIELFADLIGQIGASHDDDRDLAVQRSFNVSDRLRFIVTHDDRHSLASRCILATHTLHTAFADTLCKVIFQARLITPGKGE